MLGVIVPGGYLSYCILNCSWDLTKWACLAAKGCKESGSTFSLIAGRAAAGAAMLDPEVAGVGAFTATSTGGSIAKSIAKRAVCASFTGGLVQGSVLMMLCKTHVKE